MMGSNLNILLTLCTAWCLTLVKGQQLIGSASESTQVPCYDRFGRAQRCFPPFINAAYDLQVEATNTCGMNGEEPFCQQTGISGNTKSCDVCNNRDERKAHPPRFLTDFHSVEVPTWWQSSTMLDSVQYPNMVNLTLNLGKSFEITYVRIKFHSSRPESFAIYKRTKQEGSWEPYQFYSASCRETYNLPVSAIIRRNNEDEALCRDDFSDISPLTGASVAFSTLEGRPSAYNFENSPVLQDWVTATDIRITLNRINTFRDEVFGDTNVLRSYFYAISDFAVGGRCKCNGHASECIKTRGPRGTDILQCRCEHNTTGPDCNECLPFYNDQPWRRATQTDAFECKQCNCNGLSTTCYFDEELYRRTGHGGHCTNCRDNAAGPNCDQCMEGSYKRHPQDRCQPCACNPTGSRSQQCDANGMCQCLPGVMGEKCDRCEPNHFGFSSSGCRRCQCNVAGCANNRPECDESGQCRCKENVQGANCDQCKPGYFGLSESDPLGCMPCFCYGHSSRCSAASGYTTMVIHSDFDSGVQRWRGEMRPGQDVQLQFNNYAGNIGASTTSYEPVYFIAPDRYLGDQRHSYNLLLTFDLWVGDDRQARPGSEDIVIEGNGLKVVAAIFSQNNQPPRSVSQEYKFRLNEHPNYQWTPRITATEFMRLLANVTSIKIRATYSQQGTGFIDNVKLQSAREGYGGTPATNVERCECPEGYVGQFCESCAPGYRRDPVGGGPQDRCVPCNCNKHSDSCDAVTGRCICKHNTVGDSCERCAPGYYGYALAGTPDDCKQCPCPDNGACIQLLDGNIACTGCREGYTGHRCNMCQDGYFGDPEGTRGRRSPCQKCMCNENIDPNAVGNCDRITGECLKCIYNTAGPRCEKCLPLHYGDALALPKGQCKSCGCYAPGTAQSRPGEDCDVRTGRCYCKPQVIGDKCDQCIEGYWNIDSGNGCEPCNCDYAGSYNQTCDLRTGQCYCKPGVNSKRCDSCAPNYYGFSQEGCKACNCNPDGSVTEQCDQTTGKCECKPNIGGKLCNRCAENKHNIAAGCIDCPACYNLVQDGVDILRRKINELRTIIRNIQENPEGVDDAEFRAKLREVERTVTILLEDAKRLSGQDGGSIENQLKAMLEALTDITISIQTITVNIQTARRGTDQAGTDTSTAERTIDEAERMLLELEMLLEREGKKALQDAIDAQGKMGQQSGRLKLIAEEARTISIRQETESVEIQTTSNEALNTSNEALRIASNAISLPGEIGHSILTIRREVDDVSRLYNETKRQSDAAKKKADETYEESLQIYTDVSSIIVTSGEVGDISDKVNRIKNDAAKIKEEANQLIEQHRDLMREVQTEKREASILIERGLTEQQKTDELLAEADAARDMARKAVEKAENLLREANETLQILLEFDMKVKNSQKDAAEALKKIPLIEQYIREAEDKTSQARNNLRDAEQDALAAKEIAERAKIIAEKAYTDIQIMRNETEVLKKRSDRLTVESNQLLADVDAIERRLEALERQAEEDARLAKEAQTKADQAKDSATRSSEKVNLALATVNDIIRQLGLLDKIDIQKLDELEVNLSEAERKLIDAGIDVRYEELQKLFIEMNQWVFDYTNQLLVLTSDVENIRQINATIPRTCFKKVTLEPTDPTRLASG